MNNKKILKKWEKDCEAIEKLMDKNNFLQRWGVSQLVRCDPTKDNFKYNVIMEVIDKCDCCGRYNLRPLGPAFKINETEVSEAIETKIIERTMVFIPVGMGVYDFSVCFDRDIDTCFYYLEK